MYLFYMLIGLYLGLMAGTHRRKYPKSAHVLLIISLILVTSPVIAILLGAKP